LITPREDLAAILTNQFPADTNIKILPLDEPEKTALFIQKLL
jgi:molybdopterin-guanine dinucleotide biosynthesis protein